MTILIYLATFLAGAGITAGIAYVVFKGMIYACFGMRARFLPAWMRRALQPFASNQGAK